MGARAQRLFAGQLALRLASAAVGMPIIVGAILVGGPLFAALLGLALLVALGEIAAICGVRRGAPAFLLAAAGLGAALGVALTDAAPLHWVLLIAALSVFAATTLEAALRESAPEAARLNRYLSDGAVMSAALLYLAAPAAAIVLIRATPGEGAEWMLLGVLAVMSTDAAAYAGGRTLGRRPLAPAISPNKTVEGRDLRLARRGGGGAGAGSDLRARGRRLAADSAGAGSAARGAARRPRGVAFQARAGRQGLVQSDSRPRGRAGSAGQPPVRAADHILFSGLDLR